MYWPQRDTFRRIDRSTWEIKANFSSLGKYEVQIVTANELGRTLLRYFRKVASENEQRKKRLQGKVNIGLLGDLYPPIDMNGLPKGLRLESSVSVVIVPRVVLHHLTVDPTTIARGQTLKINYDIECFEDIPSGVWLGSSFNDAQTEKLICKTSQDEAIPLLKGRRAYSDILPYQETFP
jgi:hypothetical protein